jgi:hypothetical protein
MRGEIGGSMNVLMMLLVQSVGSSAFLEDPLPRFGEVEPQMERREIYPWIGIQPIAVYTAFASGLRVEDGWGVGADATVTLDYGTHAFLGFRLGALGWNTRTEPRPGTPDDGVQVRQYRVGIFGSFPFRFMEIGVGANVGAYRFRRDGHNDTAGYFEFQVHLGVRPSPYVWAGIIAMQTLTVTDFNHSNDHGYANYSIGPSVEVRF